MIVQPRRFLPCKRNPPVYLEYEYDDWYLSRLEENLGVTVASIPTLRGVFHTMVHEFRSRSKYLRSLLGKRATNAENFDNDNSEVSIMKRTKREYYELQEVAATPQNLHTSKEHKGLGTKEVWF